MTGITDIPYANRHRTEIGMTVRPCFNRNEPVGSAGWYEARLGSEGKVLAVSPSGIVMDYYAGIIRSWVIVRP